jgi:hypothetical protein
MIRSRHFLARGIEDCGREAAVFGLFGPGAATTDATPAVVEHDVSGRWRNISRIRPGVFARSGGSIPVAGALGAIWRVDRSAAFADHWISPND